VSGQLKLSFKAPYSGRYMFAVGGFNPDIGVDLSASHNIDVTITGINP
jgi:hypothetical protein